MPFEAFVSRNFSHKSLAVIEHANTIIAEYQEQGFTLTLRQLYYQFVSRDLIPNKQSEYKRLGSIINDARLSGDINWNAIEDRTRNVKSTATWDDPAEIIEAISDQYKEDLWAGQPYRPEIWIEKDALIGVIEPVCERLRVPYFACRGYTSQSEQYRAGKRFASVREADQIPVVFHLGDHDPSGIDMTRDNLDRLTMFAGADVEVVRLALNMDQVTRYKPPPNPAKDTDSRFEDYRQKFGERCWELDALNPTVIDKLIEAALLERIVKNKWKAAAKKEESQRALLVTASKNWEDVASFIGDLQ